MYTTKSSSIGTYDVIGIFDVESETGFEVIPAYGGRLNALSLSGDKAKGVQLLSGFESQAELEEDAISKSAILFPFPNRIDRGQYNFEGQSYQFPINETDKDNALHGFLTDARFNPGEIEVHEDSGSIELNYSYDGQFSYYPFAFDFSLKYHLEDRGTLTLLFTVTNNSDKRLPFGIGWHPYFFLPNWTNVQLSIGQFEQLILDERLIPNGRKSMEHGLNNFIPVTDLQLDDCYKRLTQNEVLAKLVNHPLDLNLEVWGDPEYFDFVQIYTPPGEDSVALEPMTCNVNAYNNQMGLEVLEPGQTFNTKCGVRLK